MLLRKTSSQGGRGGSLATMLMKHIMREKRKLQLLTSSSSSSVKSDLKTSHTQMVQDPDHPAAGSGWFTSHFLYSEVWWFSADLLTVLDRQEADTYTPTKQNTTNPNHNLPNSNHK